MERFAWFNNLSWLGQGAIVYLVLINIVTFFYFGFDKWFASLGSRRVSEKTLWILSLIGGSLGALGAMQLFRHKTKKNSFQLWFTVIFLLQVTIVFFLLTKDISPKSETPVF